MRQTTRCKCARQRRIECDRAIEIRKRRAEIVLAGIRRPAVVEGIGKRRIQCNGLIVVGDGAVEVARLKEKISAADVAQPVTGVGLQSNIEIGERTIACAVRRISQRAVDVNLCGGRIEGERPTEIFNGARIVALFRTDETAFVERNGEPRLEADRSFKVENCAIELAGNAIGFAAPGITCGETGIECDRALIVGDRFVIIAVQHVDVGALIERLDVPRIDRNCARVVLGGAVEIALRLIERAAVGKSARALRIGSHTRVEVCRWRDPSGPARSRPGRD